MPFAIIGGTGVSQTKGLDMTPKSVATPFGAVDLSVADDVVFCNRHAPDHSVPPHKINARAQISALNQLGVKRVFALYAVGLINENMQLGVPTQVTDFIDLAPRTDHTFFDTLTAGHGHVDLSHPFCPALTVSLQAQERDHQSGIYACTQGPRLETPAEIRALGKLGADMVGMTLSPEVPLALEKGMSVCALALPINWAAGVKPDMDIDPSEFRRVQDDMIETVLRMGRATTDADCAPARIF